MMPDDHIAIRQCATEDIESTADRQVNPSAPKLIDPNEVVKSPSAPGICGWNRRVLTEHLHKRLFDTRLMPFYIDAMHQKFIALASQLLQGLRSHTDIGKSLPAIRDNPVLAIALAAAQVEHKTRLANPSEQRIKPRLIDLTVTKDKGRDDDMASARVQVAGRIVQIHPAAHLQPPGIRRERRQRRILIPRPECNDMPASQSILPIQFCELRRRAVSRKIRLNSRAIAVRQRTADNLHDTAIFEIYTRSEFHDAQLPVRSILQPDTIETTTNPGP